MPEDIGFIASFGLLSNLREQEIIQIKEKKIFVMIAMIVTVIAYIKSGVKKKD